MKVKVPVFQYEMTKYGLNTDGDAFLWFGSLATDKTYHFDSFDPSKVNWIGERELDLPVACGRPVFPYAPGMVIKIKDLDSKRLERTKEIFKFIRFTRFDNTNRVWPYVRDFKFDDYDKMKSGNDQLLFGYIEQPYPVLPENTTIEVEVDFLQIWYRNSNDKLDVACSYVLRSDGRYQAYFEGDRLDRLLTPILPNVDTEDGKDMKLVWSRKKFSVQNTPENVEAWGSGYNPPYAPGMLVEPSKVDTNRVIRTMSQRKNYRSGLRWIWEAGALFPRNARKYADIEYLDMLGYCIEENKHNSCGRILFLENPFSKFDIRY